MRIPLLPIALLTIMAADLCAQEVPPRIDLDLIDTSVRPGDDFYQYACGRWLARTSVPDGVPRVNTFSEQIESLNRTIQDILEEAARDSLLPAGDVRRKLGDFFASGVQAASLRSCDSPALKRELELIAAISCPADLQRALARLQLYGFCPLFQISDPELWELRHVHELFLRQDGLGLPARGYYLNENARASEVREKYTRHISRMFELLGFPHADAARDARTVLAIETRLASLWMPDVGRTEFRKLYNKTSLMKLGKLIPAFSWPEYFAEWQITAPEHVILGQPDYFKELGKMLTAVDLEDWRTYLRWTFIHGAAKYLGSDLLDEHTSFYTVYLSGYTQPIPRSERVAYAIGLAMPEAIGKLYVERCCPPEVRDEVLALIENLRRAFRRRIERLAWMGDDEKRRSLDKLEAMTFLVGGSDTYDDYAALEIDRRCYLSNLLRARQYARGRKLALLGKPVDRSGWTVLPQSESGWYDANRNTVTLPAASLQPPLFVPGGDPACNYGGLGTAIAHEMTHGFDTQGRQFDKNGKQLGFWKRRQPKGFKKRTEILVRQYDAFEALDGYRVDGRVTLMENLADYGGVVIAFDALQLILEAHAGPLVVAGFTPEQRFFLAYAQKWKDVIRDDALIESLRGPHAPARLRAIGPLLNMDAFYRAFDIQPTDVMYRPPEERVSVW
jgi:putative endopeptidase